MLCVFPQLCVCRELDIKQGSLKKENLVENGGLTLGGIRAQLAGSLGANPATHQRGKGKHRSKETKTVLSKCAQPRREDQPEREHGARIGTGKIQ